MVGKPLVQSPPIYSYFFLYDEIMPCLTVAVWLNEI